MTFCHVCKDNSFDLIRRKLTMDYKKRYKDWDTMTADQKVDMLKSVMTDYLAEIDKKVLELENKINSLQ